MEKLIRLEMPEPVAHMVMELLGQRPYIQVAPIIKNFYTQIESQKLEDNGTDKTVEGETKSGE